MKKKISRFIFNFRSHCNMQCPYCYIPFIDSNPGNLLLWEAIIDKLATYNPDIVTFGGGDPFAYKEFVDLIKYCKKYSFQIHIDTNTIGLTKDKIIEIMPLVNIIGVPLDGDMDYHDSLREFHGHHDMVHRRIGELSKCNIPTRINTVLFPKCKNQLLNIAHELQPYPNIRQWFIYEYWHFFGINEYIQSQNNTFNFSEVYDKLKNISGIQTIHYSTVSERSPAYIFVSSLGNLYTIASDGNTYIELGNIFDSDADRILDNITNTEYISNRTKLKMGTDIQNHKKIKQSI